MYSPAAIIEFARGEFGEEFATGEFLQSASKKIKKHCTIEAEKSSSAEHSRDRSENIYCEHRRLAGEQKIL